MPSELPTIISCLGTNGDTAYLYLYKPLFQGVEDLVWYQGGIGLFFEKDSGNISTEDGNFDWCDSITNFSEMTVIPIGNGGNNSASSSPLVYDPSSLIFNSIIIFMLALAFVLHFFMKK